MPKQQRQVWSHLGPAKDLGFCLYGGTALALRFGHRESVDFDFFCADPLNKAALKKKLPILKGSVVIQDDPDAYVVLAAAPGGVGQVKISFFGSVAFGRVGAPELSADGVLLAASLRDLMATKLKVLFDRVEPKDYLDIAEMIKRGVNLKEGICDALTLFPDFSPMYCLKTLCFFDLKELAQLDRKCKTILVKAATATAQETGFLPAKKRSLSLTAGVNRRVIGSSPKDTA